MFSNSQIIYEPDYKKILYSIISEYSSLEDYNNDENNYFNNLNIIFYTKTKPDTIHSTIKVDDKYYVSMSIDDIRKIISKCYDSDPFSNELLTGVVKYLPSVFFEDLTGIFQFKNKKNLSINNPRFIPNNRDEFVILDDLSKLNQFIKNYSNKFFNYELKRLCHITIRLNISKSTMDKICAITNNNSFTKFLLKDNNEIVFDNIPLNNALSDINIKGRQTAIRTLYNSTKNDAFLSNDVLYKFIVTRSIEEWLNIFDNYRSFDNTDILGIVDIIKSYEHIYNLFMEV